jgi:regulator of protease activity HflC (stomatin/prohibitin superfamily)
MNQFKEFFQWVLDAIKIWVIVQPWEQGIRTRRGKSPKKIESGIHFKIPYIDSVYVQEVRTRSLGLSMQTLTTKDMQTLTINSNVLYQIVDIEKLYQTLFHPEATISSIASSKVTDFIFKHNLAEINPQHIEAEVLKLLKSNDHGIQFESYQVTSFAAVKTFRLIQDGQSWIENRVNMNQKK